MSLPMLKNAKRALIQSYATPSNSQGLWQVLSTFSLFVGCWAAIVWAAHFHPLAVAGLVVLLSLLLLRIFVLMHECGHNSLCRTPFLNRCLGFVFGVLSGMPQFVWSTHHAYHHSTNGNWAKYRGPLSVATVESYKQMSSKQQRHYQRMRSVLLAPIAGLMYLLVYPRLNWLKGTLHGGLFVLRQKIRTPQKSISHIIANFKTPYWESTQAYWHMLANNLALFSFWWVMITLVGFKLFIVCYLLSMALSGGAGLILFIVQHNFEHAYASSDQGWDYDQAALEGTSFLVLPAWLNWVTANIGYHHIHHLSARIPNYRLAACHDAHTDLFAGVKTISMREILPALKCILWDEEKQRICSVASLALPSIR